MFYVNIKTIPPVPFFFFWVKWKESFGATQKCLVGEKKLWILAIKEQGFDTSLERVPVIPSCLWLLQQNSPSCGVAEKVLKPKYSSSPDRPGIFTN